MRDYLVPAASCGGDLDPVGRDRQRQAGRLVGEGVLADLDLLHLACPG